MTYKYKYLGRRGIFIEGKHYHCGEIVETSKPIEELNLNPRLFADLSEKDEKRKIKEEIKILEEERERLRKASKREMKALENAYKTKLERIERKLESLKRAFEEETSKTETKSKILKKEKEAKLNG